MHILVRSTYLLTFTFQYRNINSTENLTSYFDTISYFMIISIVDFEVIYYSPFLLSRAYSNILNNYVDISVSFNVSHTLQ